jgi:hypothetical protein
MRKDGLRPPCLHLNQPDFPARILTSDVTPDSDFAAKLQRTIHNTGGFASLCLGFLGL